MVSGFFVVVPTRNRPALLARCLEAIGREVEGSDDVSVCVVDDASGEGCANTNRELCAEYGFTCIYHERKRGSAASRNHGAELGNTTWLVFVDDDVVVGEGWPARLREATARHADAVGIEGRVMPSGDGLWDREVSNLSGGLYLSCHLVLRKAVFDRVGGFDTHFVEPFAEDHELAARILQWGKVVFESSLTATHLPRNVSAGPLLRRAWPRMHDYLRAELYFFMKHRDRYHSFRHAPGFPGLLRDTLLKHTLVTLRRRRAADLFRHPARALLLLCTCLVEQAAAWWFVPEAVRGLASMRTASSIACIDTKRTSRLWSSGGELDLENLRLRGSLPRSVLFRLSRRPVYEALSNLRVLSSAGEEDPRLYLRIDDVFFRHRPAVERLCGQLHSRNVPFLAAITAEDFRNRDLVDLVERSGAMAGLHGFTHQGTFGPYPSETLQMSFPVLRQRLKDLRGTSPNASLPPAFIPPFNAINAGQVCFLSDFFHIICGGPETARFTGAMLGPLAVGKRAWYVPSFYPFYRDAAGILALVKHTLLPATHICITLHMTTEMQDDFRALMSLVDRIGKWIRPWEYFCRGEVT